MWGGGKEVNTVVNGCDENKKTKKGEARVKDNKVKIENNRNRSRNNTLEQTE